MPKERKRKLRAEYRLCLVSTVKLENKRSAVLGAVHAQTLNSCIAFGSPGKSKSVHLLGNYVSVEKWWAPSQLPA